MTAALLLAFALSVTEPVKLPFAVEATENVSADFPGAPRLESASFGQLKGRWLFIGGRIAGYHATGGTTADFARSDANRDVWVVDTTCKPAKAYHLKVDLLPVVFAPLKDEWISTGQAYYQDGESLYIAGGYGQDSSGHWVTYPIISKIELPRFIDGVMKGKFDPSSVTYSRTKLVQSAGGELIKLSDGFFYLVMGHVFMGSYTAFEGHGERNSGPVTQAYLNEIRKLKLVSDGGGSLSVTLVEAFRDETEFHRRDLTVAKILSPRGVGLAAFGGVFTPDQLSYSKPVYLFPNERPTVDQSFDQKLNAYKSAKLLLYDSVRGSMYTTLFGGISRFQWDATSSRYLENAKSGDKSSSNYLDGLQWSDQISTIERASVGGREETREFVQSCGLPAFVGTDALFIPLPNVKRALEGSDVLDLASLSETKTPVGYLYGGIRAFPFRFPYNKSAAPYNAGTVPTQPSDLILKVYVSVGKN